MFDICHESLSRVNVSNHVESRNFLSFIESSVVRFNQIGSTINNLTYKHKWNESQLIAIKTPPRVVIRTQFIIIRNVIELVEIRTLLISTRHGDFVIIVFEKEGEWRREREKGENDRHRQTQRQTSREKKIDGWRNREGDSERKQRE